MTFEEKYREYMETVRPDPALLEKTRALMAAELNKKMPRQEAEPEMQPAVHKPAEKQPAERKETKLRAVEGKKTKPAPRRSKKNQSRWWGYAGVAIAASLLTAVVLTGANRFLQRKGDAKNAVVTGGGMLMSSAAEAEFDETAQADMAETNELEYADIQIYYVEDGKIVGESQYMECSVDKIVDVWAMKNGIHDLAVNAVEFQDEGNAIGIHVDVSATIVDQLDEKGLKIQALTRTLSEYLNADSVSITAEGVLLG